MSSSLHDSLSNHRISFICLKAAERSAVKTIDSESPLMETNDFEKSVELLKPQIVTVAISRKSSKQDLFDGNPYQTHDMSIRG